MLGWLVEHLGSGGLGGVLGILGHLGTEAFGWLRERDHVQGLEEVAADKALAQVQVASYQYADWLHPAFAVLLLGVTVYAGETGAEHELLKSLTTWTGIGVGWMFGRLNRYRKPS